MQEQLALLKRDGDMVRAVRENADFSQQEVASAIGMARSTLQRVENGEMFMAMAKLLDMLEMCGVTNQAFFNRLFSKHDYTPQEETDLDQSLADWVVSLPIHSKRLLHEMAYDNWGGDILQMIELSYMDTKLPLLARVAVSEMVLGNYTICSARGEVKPGMEPPDVEGLRETNQKAREAAMKGKESY